MVPTVSMRCAILFDIIFVTAPVERSTMPWIDTGDQLALESGAWRTTALPYLQCLRLYVLLYAPHAPPLRGLYIILYRSLAAGYCVTSNLYDVLHNTLTILAQLLTLQKHQHSIHKQDYLKVVTQSHWQPGFARAPRVAPAARRGPRPRPSPSATPRHQGLRLPPSPRTGCRSCRVGRS